MPVRSANLPQYWRRLERVAVCLLVAHVGAHRLRVTILGEPAIGAGGARQIVHPIAAVAPGDQPCSEWLALREIALRVAASVMPFLASSTRAPRRRLAAG
jgi:hypothetical protein